QIEYKKLPDGGWFYLTQNTEVNLSFTANKDSLSTYTSKRIDNIAKGNRLISKYIQYSTSENLDGIKADEWKHQPEFAYNSDLPKAYSHVDNLNEYELVKAIDKIGGRVLITYFNVGKIDSGSVFDIYHTNAIEAHRFSVPLRTSEQLCQR